jgi:hypothetical protein
MTLRERLAGWISGGALTRKRGDLLYFIEAASKRREALNAITAQETPSANATVRRMVRIAREALK